MMFQFLYDSASPVTATTSSSWANTDLPSSQCFCTASWYGGASSKASSGVRPKFTLRVTGCCVLSTATTTSLCRLIVITSTTVNNDLCNDDVTLNVPRS